MSLKLPNILSFYFIAPIENLEGIMRYGILCHNKIKKLNLTHADLSDPDVQQRRRFNQDFYPKLCM